LRVIGRDLIQTLAQNSPGDTEENHEKLRIAVVLTEIRTEYVPN
jgi:hypothetical protein